ncbi:hypothetical protein NDU88_007089, partial [Pleurodeles waltl]
VMVTITFTQMRDFVRTTVTHKRNWYCPLKCLQDKAPEQSLLDLADTGIQRLAVTFGATSRSRLNALC